MNYEWFSVLQPLDDRIIVKVVEQEEVSHGGIVIPDAIREKPQEGEVIAVGPGRLTDEGKRNGSLSRR